MSKRTQEYNHGWSAGFRDGSVSKGKALEDESNDTGTFALVEAQLLLDRSTGYLRVGRSSSGATYVRWKWTQGPLAGQYTFMSDRTLCHALAALCVAVIECEEGKRKATMDTGYRPATKSP